ncbi:MAG TPA: hypothetical protein PK176_10345 [Acidobacteriota bacterium]|nr:hypothetical protein [Acidobacteriota bacterium]HQM63700.1 hypothetical protein [Acidobacteriota bacterium]
MVNGIRSALTLVCLCLIAAGAAAAPVDTDAIKEYYESATRPRVQLVAEQGRDAGVFAELQVPTILAALKYQLDKGTWSNLARADRQRLVDCLNDSNLKFIYTGLQSSMAMAAGGQTIDANTVKFNQDGWYSSGGGGEARSALAIAKIIIHELGHVYQERYNYLPRPGPTKEWFPNELEEQLPADMFTPEALRELAKILNRETDGPCSDISGSWTGVLTVADVQGSSAINVGQKRNVGGGNFTVIQEGCEVTLKFMNNEIRGTVKGTAATLNKRVAGALAEAVLTLEGGRLKVTLKQTISDGFILSEGLLTQ